jgi:hypothetical protein
MKRVPTEEELVEWLHHPVTEAFQEFLRKWQGSLQDQWAAGQFQVDSTQATAARNAGALGQVSMIKAILGLEYERFREVLEDDESSEGENSVGPRGNG